MSVQHNIPFQVWQETVKKNTKYQFYKKQAKN